MVAVGEVEVVEGLETVEVLETEAAVDSEEAEAVDSGPPMEEGSGAVEEAGVLPEAEGPLGEAEGAEEASEREGRSWWNHTDMKVCSSVEAKRTPW